MNQLRSDVDKLGAKVFTARDYRPGSVHHVVLFRLRSGVPIEQRREVVRRFRALADTPHPDGSGAYIVSIAAGPQNSGEAADHGFEVGFVVRFASEGDRNFYVGAPLVTDAAFHDQQHASFKEFVGPLLEAGRDGVLVFDFTETETESEPSQDAAPTGKA